MSALRLDGIQSVDLNGYFGQVGLSDCHRIGITTCGYESRSTYWAARIDDLGLRERFAAIHALGFKDYDDQLSRPKNDMFCRTTGLKTHCMDNDERISFISAFTTILSREREAAGDAKLELHIDYSCMPRSWYCELPTLLYKHLKRDERACLWYSKGIYAAAQYPTAGVNDFRIFSGRPSLDPGERTHVFGLGFDKIRSHAIWSVLEPKNLVCFFAERGARTEYIRKVRNDNSDILAASSLTFSVPIDDFVGAFSRIRAVILDLRLQGDVIIVPDGPKQLVLASSLVPLTVEGVGVVCFHVRRRKDPDIKIIDVEGEGIPSGFLMYGGA